MELKNQRCTSCGRRAPRSNGEDISLCDKCQKGLEETLEDRWFDKWIIRVEEMLNPEQLKKWNTLEKEVKKAFIMECIDKGVIKVLIK